jgi:hypothetical protein
MIDIPLDWYSAIKFPQIPLIDLDNYPLKFPWEGSSCLRPFLKEHLSPLSFEENKLILQNIMSLLGGGIYGGNQSPPEPPLCPWVVSIYGPLNFPINFHDLPENYLKIMPKYDGEKIIYVEEHMGSSQDFIDNLFLEHEDVFMRLFVQKMQAYVKNGLGSYM